MSAYHGVPGDLSYPGLLNLGQFEPFTYQVYELPLFVLMGVCGGLLGALWNHINYKLSVFRVRMVLRLRWLRVVEACLVAATTATIGFLTMYILNDCKPLGDDYIFRRVFLFFFTGFVLYILGQDPTKYPVQLYCDDGEYNAVAAIWFQTPEASVRSLFHDPAGSHKLVSLLVFVCCYFLLSTWTFGLSVSVGLFIPSLLTGAAWGRLFAVCLQSLFPNAPEALFAPGKLALVGAAAQLGGVVRMTISLTVIIMETTGNIR